MKKGATLSIYQGILHESHTRCSCEISSGIASTPKTGSGSEPLLLGGGLPQRRRRLRDTSGGRESMHSVCSRVILHRPCTSRNPSAGSTVKERYSLTHDCGGSVDGSEDAPASAAG